MCALLYTSYLINPSHGHSRTILGIEDGIDGLLFNLHSHIYALIQTCGNLDYPMYLPVCFLREKTGKPRGTPCPYEENK